MEESCFPYSAKHTFEGSIIAAIHWVHVHYGVLLASYQYCSCSKNFFFEECFEEFRNLPCDTGRIVDVMDKPLGKSCYKITSSIFVFYAAKNTKVVYTTNEIRGITTAKFKLKLLNYLCLYVISSRPR